MFGQPTSQTQFFSVLIAAPRDKYGSGDWRSTAAKGLNEQAELHRYRLPLSLLRGRWCVSPESVQFYIFASWRYLGTRTRF